MPQWTAPAILTSAMACTDSLPRALRLLWSSALSRHSSLLLLHDQVSEALECAHAGRNGGTAFDAPCETSLPCLQLPTGAHGGQPNDTWISGRNADLSGQASQEQLNNEQLAAAQGQAGVRSCSHEYLWVH